MEDIKQNDELDDKEWERQMPAIMPVSPEKEMPRPLTQEAGAQMESSRQLEPGSHADAELTIMLKQIEAYFTKQARSHDLEAISFSLRHLFSRVDFLYRQALPDLGKWATRKEKGKETFLHQQIWLHLQAVNRTLDRMAPLCHLLSDVIECLLDTLDNEDLWLRTFEEEETLLLDQVHGSPKGQKRPPAVTPDRTQAEQATIEAEGWEKAVSELMDRLLVWQEQQHKLPSFHEQFPQPTLAVHGLGELDTAFAVLLDSAGAIFGDILPNFRLVGLEDSEEISALLFDLMQQSDQMLVQFEVTLEPLTSLLRHFAAACESD